MSNRGALTASSPTLRAAVEAQEALGAAAPELVPAFAANLPRAADLVARRLVGAAQRERVTNGRLVWDGDRAFLPLADGGYLVTPARQHAFGRVEVTEQLAADPAELLLRFAGKSDEARSLGGELTDACVGLALAYARQKPVASGLRDSLDLVEGLDPDTACVELERLATEGHNLHPCGRTRLGWSIADRLAYDLESPGLSVGFVGLRRDFHVGDDLEFPDAGLPDVDRSRYVVTPVHPWQWEMIVRRRYADLVQSGAIVRLDGSEPARPTAALRTLLLGAGESRGAGGYLKVSLDILVTSTRRSISVASTRNAVPVSALVARLLGEADLDDRVLLMAETSGSAGVVSAQRERDLAAIVRSPLAGRLREGEIPVPGGALCAVSPVTGASVVAEIVERFARTRALPRRPAALRFVSEYAELLLPPVLLALRGVGLEGHLQNCVPTFVEGVPHRIALRDLAGLRLFLPRLDQQPTLWPGSVIVAEDLDTMRAKVAYTALQAHLGEIVVQLAQSHDLDEPAAWAAIRGVLDQIFDRHAADPRAQDDHAFFTGPTLPHKALLSMRLAALRGSAGDIYVRVENPLR